MSDVIISAEGLGKSFRLQHKRPQRYVALRDVLTARAHALGGWLRGRERESFAGEEEFWALRNVSFRVKRGEVLGIIGRNGAGKSTLLKILSRITEPTEGRVRIRGRVSSLLEVGTGFHPELTGRENVFLNGTILGMDRVEIKRKFDEIVAFAEVERFLDTPVKHYSSGMYVRLAFAVAAHLEPEILIVDEVLAVGDMEFQKKCLGKMRDASAGGRTILFVSHNMAAINRLCSRGIMLANGSIYADGPVAEVVSAYLQSGLGRNAEREWRDIGASPGNDIVRLRSVRVCTEQGEVAEALDIRNPILIEMEYDVLTAGCVLNANIHLYNEEGICVCICIDQSPVWKRTPRPVGRYRSVLQIPGNYLAEGMLIVTTAIATLNPMTVHVHETDVVSFQVVDSVEGDSARGDFGGDLPGVVRPLFEWRTENLSSVAKRA